MSLFIVRHPSYYKTENCKCLKDCIKEYIKEVSPNIGNMIEMKRNAEINHIIVDNIAQLQRSIVDVKFKDGYNLSTSNHVQILSRQVPFNVPYSNFIPVNINQPITTIDNDGLTISPSILDLMEEQRMLPRLALLSSYHP